MTEQEEFANTIRSIMTEVLHERRTVDDDDHTIHHAWIQVQMECQKENEMLCKWVKEQIQLQHERREMWSKFKSSFVGGIALAMLAGLGWLGKLVMDALSRGHS